MLPANDHMLTFHNLRNDNNIWNYEYDTLSVIMRRRKSGSLRVECG